MRCRMTAWCARCSDYLIPVDCCGEGGFGAVLAAPFSPIWSIALTGQHGGLQNRKLAR